MNRVKDWFLNAWARTKVWFVGVLAALGFVVISMAAPVDMSWTNATQRMDGSPFDAVAEQAEVRVYCDIDPATFQPEWIGQPQTTAPTFVSSGSAENFTGDLSLGSHPCFKTTFDIFGQESDPGVVKIYVVTPSSRPNPPIDD